MKTLKLFVCALSILGMAGANAALIRVSQETSAGSGDFDANVLGIVTTVDTALTAAAFYQYGNPDAASYNGDAIGGPAPLSDVSQTFIHSGTDGLSLIMVHDAPNDGTGGNTRTRWNLNGDTAGQVVADDPGEPLTISGGGTQFDSSKVWISCCTDGYGIGDLNGDWEMIGQFLTAPTGISSWQVTSGDGANIGLTLSPGLRVRLDQVAVPEPSNIALLLLGLAGLFGVRLARR